MSEDPIPTCFDCANAPTERLVEMFVDIVQRQRIRLGQTPAERPVFRKLHGVAHGRLEMMADAPAELRVGVFAQTSLPAWVRFSSDTSPTSPDLLSTLGIGIKVFGVPGPNALGEDGDTADFIMQNHPVFFVDDARAMCEFTYAGVVEGDYPGYLARHRRTAEILDAMETVEGSVLTTTYWAILPFGAGADQVVKYRLEPETPPENVPNDAAGLPGHRHEEPPGGAGLPVPLHGAAPDKSRDHAAGQGDGGVAAGREPVRPGRDAGPAPPGRRRPRPGRLRPDPGLQHLPRPARAGAGPGILDRGGAQGRLRRQRGGAPPSQRPGPARRSGPARAAAAAGARRLHSVKAAIYPSIGIARVGNSPHDYVIGPEVPDPPALPPGAYRDDEHRLKRQAARFRLYGLNAKGEIVRELTGEERGVEIAWTVELANTKAAWYGFQLALDIPEAASAPPTTLRNAAITDRTQLAITPGPRTVAGRGAPHKAFDSGKFMGQRVYLGEVFTDEAGRLIVLGGRGESASCDGTWAITFANNEGWRDDVSDGPVTAEVELDGKPLEVIPAWVVVAPPDYGPRRKSVRTMWDLMRDVAIKSGKLAAPQRPSFTHDILPIFQRLNGLQWVNAGFAAGFGWDGAFDVASPRAIARLADRSAANQEVRRTLANQFRRFAVDSWSPKPWPWLYGDAMNIPPAPTPRQNAALSDCQLAMLDQWAAGDFEADYDADHVPPSRIEDVPVKAQGEVLNRAALEFCLADAFHPGCEMTWPVRTATMYMAPFRFAHAPPGWIEPNLGEVLTSDSMTIPNGPLYGQVPGGISRWMAVPWQTDTASCRSGYDKTYDPYVPAFWPARVPNQVLTEQNYDIVMDASRPLSERRAAFANRAAWIAPLGSTSYTDQINNMIAHFDHLGVVEQRPGPSDTGAFPALIEVEDRHEPIKDVIPKEKRAKRVGSAARAGGVHAGAPGTSHGVDITGIDKFHRFPQGLPVKFS